jgi:FkbM family methyltransferase
MKTANGLTPKMFGSEYGGWMLLPSLLDSSSIVYSFGLGTDITFDLAVIDKFGMNVFGFDPTCHSIQYLKNQNLPNEFRLCEFGLAAHDGVIQLFEPPEGFVSHSLVQGQGTGEKISISVKRLESAMTELGHREIDVLKMDIEGCEYEVIKDLVAGETLPTQLLVEFHHRILDMGMEKTKNACLELERAGYRVFHITDSGNEFSFVLES